MSWVDGSSVIVKIDTDGVPTYTALGGEIESAMNITVPVNTVVNKSTTGAAGADYGPGAEHVITVSGHVDDTTQDPAFARIMDQLRSEAKIVGQYIEPAPYDTYTFTAVPRSHGTNAPNNAPYVMSAELVCDGLPTQATTS